LRPDKANGPGSQRPNPARVYDCLLGGKNNRLPDQRAAKALLRAQPQVADNARGYRTFLRRAIACLAVEHGIRQFIDIGGGLPGMDNTHDLAQATAPASRVVYVYADPELLLHAQVLFTSTAGGQLDCRLADLREPAELLKLAGHTLDLAQPLAIIMLARLALVPDEDDPALITAQLLAPAASGSFLAIAHPASDIQPKESARGAKAFTRLTGWKQTNRTHAEILRFFDGLDLLPPGLVPSSRWRPEGDEDVSADLPNWSGVARKR